MHGVILHMMWASQEALVVKNPPADAGDLRDVGSIPELERFPGERHSNPLQYTCLENPVDGGAWWATVRGVAKSRTRLSDFTLTFFHFHLRTQPLACGLWSMD